MMKVPFLNSDELYVDLPPKYQDRTSMTLSMTQLNINNIGLKKNSISASNPILDEREI